MIQTNTFKNSNILWQAMHALIWLLMINCTIVIFQTANELYGNLTVESITYNYYNATTLGPHSRIYDSPAPRSTGISRQLLLIHFFYFFYRREIKNIPYKLFSLLILFASAYFVIAMQSRSSLYFLIFFYTFFLFFFYNISLDKKILLLCSFLLMPYLLSGYEKDYRVQLVIDKEYEKKVLEKEKIVKINPRVLKGLNRNKEKIIQDNKIATKNDSINKGTKPKIFSKKKEDRSFNERLFGLDNPVGNLFEKEKKTSKNLNSEYVQKYKKLQKTTGNRIFVKSTSGRTGLWKKSLDLIQKRPWFGYGPMSDRLLIKENVSNMFLYTLLSGGLFGFLILLYLIISISSMIYRLVFNFKIFKYNDHYPSYLSISVVYLGFLLIRGMVENSFSIYSLDFMVFCISSTLINNYLQRLKK